MGIVIIIYAMILANFDQYKFFPSFVDDTVASSSIVFIKSTLRSIHLIGRRIGLPLVGTILLFGGWSSDINVLFILLFSCIVLESLQDLASGFYYKRTFKSKVDLSRRVLIFYNLIMLFNTIIFYFISLLYLSHFS